VPLIVLVMGATFSFTVVQVLMVLGAIFIFTPAEEQMATVRSAYMQLAVPT
jgi:hypothetical protein